MNKILIILLSGMLWLVMAGVGFAKEPPGTKGQSLYKSTQDGPVQTLSNLSNWSYWMRRDGWSGRDPATGNSGGVYPRGTAAVIFQDGFIFGGFVEDTRNPGLPKLRVGGQTYVVGTTPGHIVTPGTSTSAPVASDANQAFIYRIRKDWESLAIGQATVINDAAELNAVSAANVTTEMQQQVIDDYAFSWNNWPTDLGAPTNEDGTPGIANADQVIWFVANDLNEGAVSDLYGSPPIGVELQVTAWSYNQPGATLGQLFFKRYRLINKSGFRIDSMFVAQWSDPDVGVYTDDLVGNDKDRSLGFAYSGNLTDGNFAAFGLPPASVGYDFFQGPLVDGVAGQDLNNNGVDDAEDFGLFDLKVVGPGKINLPLTSFGYFAAGSSISDPPLGDYDGTKAWYNLLNGFTPTPDLDNPTPYFAGFGANAGQVTKFPAGGDPVAQTGDIDAFGTNLPPGDRRMALPSGPFTMNDGDVQEVVVAVVGGIVAQNGGNNRNAVAQLKLNDDFAQFIFNKSFQGIPSPPPGPDVQATPLADRIILNWGSNVSQIAATEADDPLLGFNFEGYNVYQLPTASATKAQATKIATFDKNNTIGQINADQFLPEFGDIVKVPVQTGKNTGIQRFFTVETDAITGRPIFAGNTYYFAVTAYNAKDENRDGIVDTDVPEAALESALEVITVVAQAPKPGDIYPNNPGDAIEVTKVGGSTGSTEVSVVDPSQLTGSSYRVEFNEENQYNIDSHGDTLGIWHTWNLMNTTSGQTLLSNQTNLAGDFDYAVTEGLVVRVAGPKAAGLAGWDYDGNRWISGTDWGGQELFGGLDIGLNFFGSELGPNDLVPVQLVFQDQADVDANGFVSKGQTYRRDLGYPASGIGELPFSAWDVTNPEAPRRLNISFVEDENQSASNGAHANLLWDMGWNGSQFADLGGREYIFIHKSDYDEGAEYDDTNFGPSADVLYAIWPAARGSRGYLLAPFTMDIFANLPNTPADSYTFSSQAAVVGDVTAEKADVEKINVFPNPYYAFNPEEPSRFERFVTFTHLPQEATIRIFTLSGVQVRKLEKNTEGQFLRWDLRNEATLPVASGMYIAHIDMPTLGMEKVVKLFIVQGEEILEFF